MITKNISLTTDHETPLAEFPTQETTPAVDPRCEVIDDIKVDCRLAPAEYLDEVRVLVGGE